MSFFKNVKHLFIPDTIYTDRYPDLETALIAKAPLNVVQALLRYEKYQKQLHWTDWRGDDVFQLAIIQKVDNAILKLLITKGANFRHFNKNGHCALHIAANLGRTEVIKLILDFDRRVVNLRSDDWTYFPPGGPSPLHLAAAKGHLKAVQVLAFYGAELDCLGDDSTRFPIDLAIDRDDGRMVALLLSLGATRSILFDRRVLKPHALEIILKSGSDINSIGFTGRTFLHVAVDKDDAAMVGRLIRICGADPQLGSVLHYAAKEGKINALQALLDCGADPYGLDEEENIPLFIAILGGSFKCMKMLGEKTERIDELSLKRFIEQKHSQEEFKTIDLVLPHILHSYQVVWQDPAAVLPKEVFEKILIYVGEDTKIYHVCHRWRTISFITFDYFSGFDPDKHSTIAQALRQFIEKHYSEDFKKAKVEAEAKGWGESKQKAWIISMLKCYIEHCKGLVAEYIRALTEDDVIDFVSRNRPDLKEADYTTQLQALVKDTQEEADLALAIPDEFEKGLKSVVDKYRWRQRLANLRPSLFASRYTMPEESCTIV